MHDERGAEQPHAHGTGETHQVLLLATAFRPALGEPAGEDRGAGDARLAAFGLSLFGFAVSLVLRYLELWEIGAACQWCWASAVLMTSLLIVNSCRLIGYYGTDEAGGPDSGEPAVEMPATDEPEPNPAS